MSAATTIAPETFFSSHVWQFFLAMVHRFLVGGFPTLSNATCSLVSPEPKWPDSAYIMVAPRGQQPKCVVDSFTRWHIVNAGCVMGGLTCPPVSFSLAPCPYLKASQNPVFFSPPGCSAPSRIGRNRGGLFSHFLLIYSKSCIESRSHWYRKLPMSRPLSGALASF